MPTLHEILIWGYIILTVAGFCYAVGCIRGFVRLGIHRRENINPLAAMSLGLFKPNWLNEQGLIYRQSLLSSIGMGLMCSLGLALIVIIGILTQH